MLRSSIWWRCHRSLFEQQGVIFLRLTPLLSEGFEQGGRFEGEGRGAEADVINRVPTKGNDPFFCHGEMQRS